MTSNLRTLDVLVVQKHFQGLGFNAWLMKDRAGRVHTLDVFRVKHGEFGTVHVETCMVFQVCENAINKQHLVTIVRRYARGEDVGGTNYPGVRSRGSNEVSGVPRKRKAIRRVQHVHNSNGPAV